MWVLKLPFLLICLNFCLALITLLLIPNCPILLVWLILISPIFYTLKLCLNICRGWMVLKEKQYDWLLVLNMRVVLGMVRMSIVLKMIVVVWVMTSTFALVAVVLRGLRILDLPKGWERSSKVNYGKLLTFFVGGEIVVGNWEACVCSHVPASDSDVAIGCAVTITHWSWYA